MERKRFAITWSWARWRPFFSLRICERPGRRLYAVTAVVTLPIARPAADASAPLGNCLKCSSQLTVAEEEDIVADLSKMADQSGASVKIISTEFEEGAQLDKAFGGIAAILRYKTSHI